MQPQLVEAVFFLGMNIIDSIQTKKESKYNFVLKSTHPYNINIVTNPEITILLTFC